ncbi:unnamed protein product [Nezara viridula]|uniref:Neuropeptide n=1 Tax=Nezara viridula TaxID=85310 RepID=A0A9P0H9I0_NEZVI|nr:unnamed protein product [Nezara viridula]
MQFHMVILFLVFITCSSSYFLGHHNGILLDIFTKSKTSSVQTRCNEVLCCPEGFICGFGTTYCYNEYGILQQLMISCH